MAGESNAPQAPVVPVPGSPEHDAAMAAKADSVNATNDPALPKGGELSPPKEPEQEPPKEPEKPAEKEPPKEPEKEGEKPAEKPAEKEPEKEKPADTVDVKSLTAEFAEKGALSEESYKSLEGKGFDKAFVDQFIAGQQAIAAQRDAIGYEAAGGKAKFDSMADWAGQNLSPEDIAVVNKGLKGSPAEMQAAVRSLKSSYEAQFGSEPQLLNGKQGSAQEGVFASREQATAAIKDPRYKSDPAYRRSVEQRIGGMSNW